MMDHEKSRLEQFREFVDLDPTDVFSRYALGMEYMGVEDYAQAVQQFEQVMHLEPSNTAAYFQAGLACQRADQRDRAIAFLKKGIEIATGKGDRHARDEMTETLEKIEEEF